MSKKKSRVEFSAKTIRDLAGNANHLCSFTDCTHVTISQDVKEDGSVGNKIVGVAAHIYAAAGKGPRPPVGMSDEEIKAETNGIWLCECCARLIDAHPSRYPAEKLREMKLVRVTAQSLAVQERTIGDFAHYIGMKRLDRIVRAHLPELDVASITQTVKNTYMDVERALALNSPLHYNAPFARASLPMLKDVIREVTVTGKNQPQIVYGRVWQEILDTWASQLGPFPDIPGRTARIDKGYAKICAREPASGEFSKESIEADTFAMLTHDNTRPRKPFESIHQRHTFSNTSSLEWQLNVKSAADNFELESNLSMCMSIMRRHDPSDAARRAFESYASVLAKLAEGWEAIGFVGLTFGDGALEREYHPTPLNIAVRIEQQALQRGLRRIERVKMGYKLADAFEITPKFTEVWFTDLVTDQELLEGATTFLTGLGPKPWPRSVSTALLQIDHRRQLVLNISSYTLVARVELGAPATLSTQV